MKRIHESHEEWPTGARRFGASHSGLLWWGLLAALWLAVPWWSWAQSNELTQALRAVSAPIRLGALHPEQLAGLKGRPLCVYNFTSW